MAGMIPDLTGAASPAILAGLMTTILAVRARGRVAVGGDGQVTMGNTVMKADARKVRHLADGKVLAGFAGAAADAFSLLDRFEGMLKKYNQNVTRAAIELAKEWRTDRVLRRLESLLAVCDKKTLLIVSGTGEVIEPSEGIAAIGSGGPYALAAARALAKHTSLGAVEICRESLKISGEICIYSNDRIQIEEIEGEEEETKS
jgi:ATP-dependent HslUV protease, peptidase subunit HslV